MDVCDEFAFRFNSVALCCWVCLISGWIVMARCLSGLIVLVICLLSLCFELRCYIYSVCLLVDLVRWFDVGCCLLLGISFVVLCFCFD